MIRTDGTFKIYIIKHLYKKEGNDWAGSGDCGQWLGNMSVKFPDRESYRKFRKENEKLFNNLNAIGDCWQKTGVSGTYDREVAVKVCSIISTWFPEHGFKVCKVEIRQVTHDIVIFNP